MRAQDSLLQLVVVPSRNNRVGDCLERHHSRSKVVVSLEHRRNSSKVEVYSDRRRSLSKVEVYLDRRRNSSKEAVCSELYHSLNRGEVFLGTRHNRSKVVEYLAPHPSLNNQFQSLAIQGATLSNLNHREAGSLEHCLSLSKVEVSLAVRRNQTLSSNRLLIYSATSVRTLSSNNSLNKQVVSSVDWEAMCNSSHNKEEAVSLVTPEPTPLSSLSSRVEAFLEL